MAGTGIQTMGISSYLLVTQKGRTYVPFCRGSCFMLPYTSVSFYAHHVITAAHIARPHRFAPLFGNPPSFQGIGDRHVSWKAYALDREGFNTGAQQPLFLANKLDTINSVHSVSLRVAKEEEQIAEQRAKMKELEQEYYFDNTTAVTPDGAPLDLNEELVCEGVECVEDPTGVNDETMVFRHRRIPIVCRAAVTSKGFGTLVLASSETPFPPSMCGGPVIRRSSGKCVGVITAPLRTTPPEPPAELEEITHTRPVYMDITDNPGVMKEMGGEGSIGVAFTPLAEFLLQLRRLEGI